MAQRRKKHRHSGRLKNGLLWLALAVVLAVAGFVALEPATENIYQQMYPRKYRQYVEQYSREYGVDKDLVYAVARIESNFDPNAVSSADARGVMQMTQDAFEWVRYRMGEEGTAAMTRFLTRRSPFSTGPICSTFFWRKWATKSWQSAPTTPG